MIELILIKELLVVLGKHLRPINARCEVKSQMRRMEIIFLCHTSNGRTFVQ